MRTFTVEEPISKSHSNNNIVKDLLFSLYCKYEDGDIVETGVNASKSAGQERDVEAVGGSCDIDS